MAKQKEKEAKLLEKPAKNNATGQNNGMRKSQRRNSDKNLAGPNAGPVEATKPLTARQKSLQESTKVKKQKSKPMPPPQTPPNHQKETLPPPVLGTVTFLGMIFSIFHRGVETGNIAPPSSVICVDSLLGGALTMISIGSPF